MAIDLGLRAGVGRADITPPTGIAHGNWGAAVHSRAEGVDLPLWATALALQDAAGGTGAIIVECDLLLLSFHLVAAIRRPVGALTGVPEGHIRVSSSHTHSGPTLGSTWLEEGAELIEPYVASLPGKIAGAAWEAWRGLRPVRLAAGTGSCHIGINRRVQAPDGRTVVGRNHEGAFDPTVRVLRLDGADGSPLAAVLHYATHPTLMAYENRLITPDYPGPARRTVEQLTGATCLFLQGCAGDAGPRFGFTEGHTGDVSFYHRAGTILGAEAAKVFLTLETAPYEERLVDVLESGAPLGVYRHVPLAPDAQAGVVRVVNGTALLPVRQFPAREAAEATARAAREHLAAVRRAGAPAETIRDATYRAKRAAQQAGHARLTDGKPEVEIPLQAMRLGPVAILGAPLEVFGQLGAAVAAASPFSWTAVCGYTNGSAGYLPTAEAFQSGGYEVEMASAYAPPAGERFVAAASALLRRLHQA
ncbi:MAG TPA: neutral/alkaline non-lysosomal ceramidase N-terminal domain-containing protein [Chloroflexota bacterium]|nr:neutral/alkaline non-lysosomal ceramidase N-terminal domain-containing protein [Chloroflexota bacterium]